MPAYGLPPDARALLRRALRLPGGAGAMRAYLAAHRLAGRVPPNDIGWLHLPRWMAAVEPLIPPGAAQARLLLFAQHPRWVDLGLALAAALVGRGAAVDVAWLPDATHVPDVPPPLIYRPWLLAGRAQQRRWRHERLRLVALDRLPPAASAPEMTAAAEEQALIDASYALFKERLDPAAGSSDRDQIERRRRANLRAIGGIAALLDAGRYDRLLLPSGGILEFGAVHRYVRSRGLPVVSFESPDAQGRILISAGAPVVNLRTDALWAADAPHALDDARRKRIVAQLVERRQAVRDDPASPTFQPAGMVSPAAIRQTLGITGDRRIVLVCPNVPFDAIFYASARKLFTGLWEWFGHTLRLLAARRDCTVIVRAHPAEPMFQTSETAAALLAEALPEPPAHIRFVPPEAPLNTYALMQIADLGLVYASTTGLEMAMRGIPVVCGNPDQHYNGKGFTTDPASREEHDAAIVRFLRQPERPRLSDRQVELALAYADVYFNRWPLPFPWHFSSFWRDVAAVPPAELARLGPSRYPGALTLLLTGERPE